MILFPHAKINLGLNVLARRADGYNDIESVLVPIPLHDVLEAVVDPELARNELIYTRSGLSIPGAIESDLCYRAVRRIQSEYELPGLRLHLHKVIPMGAGLGGGSSDGANTLLLIDRLCGLDLPRHLLSAMALELGSDCPFFLQNEACIARGRGEDLVPLRLDLSGLTLVLANPGIHVSTAEVYRHTEPTGRSWDIGHSARRDRIREWAHLLPNTMENYVFEAYPEVGQLKRSLTEAGALHTAMSGSGSSIFGIFDKEPKGLSFPRHVRSWTLQF